jgi:hypothetical protein
MYKHTDDAIPIRSGDRSERVLSAGGGLCRYEYDDSDGRYLWTVEDKDVHMQLAMEDYHPGFGYYPEGAGAAVSQSSKHHIEAAGWVSGSVSVKGRTWQVKGLGWRDHSWGKRNWQSILAHRFYPAMFGREFSFFGVTLLGIDGNLVKLGTIIRGDTVEATSDFDIVAHMGEDGTSNIGGEVTLRMNGQSHLLRYHPVGKGAVSFHQGFPCVDTMCKVTMDGRQGVGLAETTHRAQGGTDRPHVFENSPGVIENGLHSIRSADETMP